MSTVNGFADDIKRFKLDQPITMDSCNKANSAAQGPDTKKWAELLLSTATKIDSQYGGFGGITGPSGLNDGFVMPSNIKDSLIDVTDKRLSLNERIAATYLWDNFTALDAADGVTDKKIDLEAEDVLRPALEKIPFQPVT
jgi:hypothetical protein